MSPHAEIVCAEASTPILRFSGERLRQHHYVYIHGKRVDLRHSELTLLIRLVIARATSPSGLVPEHTVPITRLRQAIDAGLGRGAGKQLIETGCGTEYCLAMPREQLADRILVEPSFFELVERGLVTADDASALRKYCRAVDEVVR